MEINNIADSPLIESRIDSRTRFARVYTRSLCAVFASRHIFCRPLETNGERRSLWIKHRKPEGGPHPSNTHDHSLLTMGKCFSIELQRTPHCVLSSDTRHSQQIRCVYVGDNFIIYRRLLPLVEGPPV